MDSFLVPNEANTAWRFASTDRAVSFFFREYERLRCQARATSTLTKTCSRVLTNHRGPILNLLENIHTITIPSADLNNIVVALSDIASCERNKHDGHLKKCQIRSDWCTKLRARYTLDAKHSNSKAIECDATLDQHGSPGCWLLGIASQYTQLDAPIDLRHSHKVQSDEQHLPIPQQSTGEYSSVKLIPNSSEQIKQIVDLSTASFDKAEVNLDTSNYRAKLTLPLRLDSTNRGSQGEETTKLVQMSDFHPIQKHSTPTKHGVRPELHRSDNRTIASSKIPDPYYNPWIDDSPATPDASGFWSSPEDASSPLSTRSIVSPIFDEPSAQLSLPDTPPTELIETTGRWNSLFLGQLADAESPSVKTGKFRESSSTWLEKEIDEQSSATEGDSRGESDFGVCNHPGDKNNECICVKRRLFATPKPRNSATVFPDEDLKKPIKRVQTLPVHNSRERELHWIKQLPKRRHSIHQLPNKTVSRSEDIQDGKSGRLVGWRHRRDSLPSNITDKDVHWSRHTSHETSHEDSVLDLDDDNYGRGKVELTDGYGTAGMHACRSQTGPLATEVPRTRLPVVQPWPQPSDSLRELCVTMRQSYLGTKISEPGYVYCYQRSCQPGHIKIGMVWASETQIEQDLTTGSAYHQQPTLTEIGVRSQTLPSSIARRMAELKYKCKYEPQVLYWLLIPFAVSRIEKLVHRQLVACRKRELICNGCRGDHTEWFEVELQEAKDAVGLWCQFAALKPYSGGCLRHPWTNITFLDPKSQSKNPVKTLSEFISRMSVWMEMDKHEGSNRAKDEELERKLSDAFIDT